uniref:hypothetical protein n=1 Tax=Microbulbifer agarilyticus TaxID=260552 RepID=UPI001303570F|nr:hypothetical protein [Microbulbifer agarilyticus]
MNLSKMFVAVYSSFDAYFDARSGRIAVGVDQLFPGAVAVTSCVRQRCRAAG